MTKRILCVLAMMSIAAMRMLSSCTAAGVECGLIGKWEYVKNNDGVKCTTTYEITADDKFIMTMKYEFSQEYKDKMAAEGTKLPTAPIEQKYTIESVSDHKIKVKEIDGELEYRNLGCDSVEFKFGDKWTKLSKVY